MSAEGPVVIKPALRAKVGTVFWLLVSAGLSLTALLLDWKTWGIAAIAVSALSIITVRKVAVAVIVPLVLAAVGKYLEYPFLPPLGALLAIVELAYVVTYIKSMKYVFKDDGLVISVEFPLYSKTRSIPKSTISEVTVESSLAGKILGYASVVVKLKTGEVVSIHGVPKKKAKELTKKLVSG